MKKVLSTVAALGLVAGLASTAAAVEFKMSGKYLVEGAYLSDSTGNGIKTTEAAAENNASNAYWLHTFEVRPTMQVNDKISMSSVIRLADDTFWGSQADTAAGTSNVNNAGDVYVHQLYMDYASPIGNMRFGRVPAGAYGTAFMDFNQRADRVMWWPSFMASGPVTTLFYMQKSTDNNNANNGPTAPATAFGTVTTNNASDADSTKYVGRVYYKDANLDAGMEYGFANNQTVATTNNVKQNVTLYGKYNLNNFFANAELVHYFGDKEYDAVGTAEQNYDSWAGMLQGGVKIDALTASLAYVYAEGQDITKQNNTIQNALDTTGTGDMFEPLYILTGRHTGILNNDIFNGSTASASAAGVHAIVAAADYAVSNQLTLHGAIGWAKADENVYKNGAVLTASNDDEYGWEYNVGAAYKLLDNLTYEAHFGYLDTGDYFNGNSATDITNNVYLMTHSLTMTF